MPRPVRPWFRFYTETFGDRKIRRLKPAQRWVWAAILGAARESPEPGRLLVAEGHPMTVAELADYAGVSEREARATLVAAEALKMVHRDGDVWVSTNFGKRQFESDNVTERTRRHRSKELCRNVPTNVPGNDGGNAPETETEAETENHSPLVSQSPPQGHRGLTDENLQAVVRRLRCSADHAARVVDDILDRAGTEVGNPWRYVVRAIDADPGRFAPTPTAGRKADQCAICNRVQCICHVKAAS